MIEQFPVFTPWWTGTPIRPNLANGTLPLAFRTKLEKKTHTKKTDENAGTTKCAMFQPRILKNLYKSEERIPYIKSWGSRNSGRCFIITQVIPEGVPKKIPEISSRRLPPRSFSWMKSKQNSWNFWRKFLNNLGENLWRKPEKMQVVILE